MFGFVKKEKVYASIEWEIRDMWRQIQYYTHLLDEETDEDKKEFYRKKIRYFRIRRDEAIRIFGYVRHVN
jgi:NTP pyrophosphatase (non-canonical NTP hydrolase)